MDITKKNFLLSLFKNFYHISPENLFENLPVRSYHTQKQEEMMERAHQEQQGQG